MRSVLGGAEGRGLGAAAGERVKVRVGSGAGHAQHTLQVNEVDIHTRFGPFSFDNSNESHFQHLKYGARKD